MKLVTPKFTEGPVVHVTVFATQGSAPREPGAWMLVSANEVQGTVGGGRVEHEAIATAREMLAQGRRDTQQ